MNTLPPNNKQEVYYEYSVEPAAAETVTNLMRREGITVGFDGSMMVFTGDRLLDMRKLKARGVIRSYTITKLVRSYQVVEEG